jgi:hypothetical protein
MLLLENQELLCMRTSALNKNTVADAAAAGFGLRFCGFSCC